MYISSFVYPKKLIFTVVIVMAVFNNTCSLTFLVHLTQLCSRYGLTALHLAAKHDNSGVCFQTLLSMKADPTITDNKVRLDYVFKRHGHQDVSKNIGTFVIGFCLLSS